MEGLLGALQVWGSGRRGTSAMGNLRGYDMNKGIYRKKILTLLYSAETKIETGNARAVAGWVGDGAAVRRESKAEGADGVPGVVLTAKEKIMGESENDKIRIIPLRELWDPKLRGANWGTEFLTNGGEVGGGSTKEGELI